MTKINELATIVQIKSSIELMIARQANHSNPLHLAMLFDEAQALSQEIAAHIDNESSTNQSLVEKKHNFISLLLLNSETLELGRIAIENLLTDEPHPDFLVRGYDIRFPNARASKKTDLLSYILFLRKSLDAPTTDAFNAHMCNLAKLLIENGDIIAAAHFAILNDNQRFDMFHCEQKPENYYLFYSMLRNFYPALYPQVREHLFGLGLERSFIGRKFTCAISHKFPTIPVRLHGKLYDLSALAEKLRIVEGRTTPYQFSFNGCEVDSREITIDRQYFSRLQYWVNDVLPYTISMEAAYALTTHNLSALFGSILVSATIVIFSSFIFDKGFPAHATQSDKVTFLLLFCSHNMAQSLALNSDLKLSLFDNISRHPNSYIRNLKKLNNFYGWLLLAPAAFCIPLLTMYSVKIKKYPDDPLYNYLPTNFVAENFKSLCFAPYLLFYTTHMLSFGMQSKVKAFRQINSEPTITLATHQIPPESRRQILFNFQQIASTQPRHFNSRPMDDDVEQGLRNQTRNAPE